MRYVIRDKILPNYGQWTRIFFDKLRVEIEDSFNAHGVTDATKSLFHNPFKGWKKGNYSIYDWLVSHYTRK